MNRDFHKNSLSVKVFPTRDEMGESAAWDVAGKINALLQDQPFVNIVFAAAPSQNEFLAALAKAAVDWSRVNAFHMDEYIGLQEDAPQRFGNFLNQAIFSKLPFASIHYLHGNTNDAAGECTRYAALLKRFPTDIACMGIGENGHLAFNDPPVAKFHDDQQVKLVALDRACRQQQVNDGCFRVFEQVPETAITLTIPALMAARYVFCMVPGTRKAEAVYNTLNADVGEACPATILRTHPHAMLYLDQASSSMLTS